MKRRNQGINPLWILNSIRKKGKDVEGIIIIIVIDSLEGNNNKEIIIINSKDIIDSDQGMGEEQWDNFEGNFVAEGVGPISIQEEGIGSLILEGSSIKEALLGRGE